LKRCFYFFKQKELFQNLNKKFSKEIEQSFVFPVQNWCFRLFENALQRKVIQTLEAESTGKVKKIECFFQDFFTVFKIVNFI
jgi:hypothetical protein